MDEQRRVARFVREQEMECPPAYRLLDLVSELGEIATDATESTEYGAHPSDIRLGSDELGDALFSLLALADAADVDAGQALDDALEKYADRIDDTGTPSSGR